MDLILFYLFGGAAVLASIFVVGQRNPMHSVLLLIVSFAAHAALYIQLDSPFAAVTQIIVYAGAILVLFLFVVMLLNAPHEDAPTAYGPSLTSLTQGPRRRFALLGVVLGAELIWAFSTMTLPESTPVDAAEVGERVSSVRAIGVQLFTEHAFAFEVTSVLILVAMVGAVVIARKEA